MALKINLINTCVILVLSIQIIGCTSHRIRQHIKKEENSLPCSERVAAKIIDLVRRDHSPKRILEIGAKTGLVTTKLISKLNPSDHLDLLEIDPLLCDVLQKKFGRLKNVAIHCMDFLDWNPDKKYDYLIFSLPFFSFSPDLAEKSVQHLTNLSSHEALLSFIEFKWLSSFNAIGKKNKQVTDFKTTRNIVNNFYIKNRLYETDVFSNFPPITVYYLKMNKKQDTF